MVKKKINWGYLFIIILIILLLVGAYKNLNNHYDKEYLVINKKILESASKCYLDNVCKDDITIKDLYDNNYLEKQIDPKTKENINDNRCITYANNEAKFCDK